MCVCGGRELNATHSSSSIDVVQARLRYGSLCITVTLNIGLWLPIIQSSKIMPECKIHANLIKIHKLVIKISHTVMLKPSRNVLITAKAEYGRWGNILLPLSEGGCLGVMIFYLGNSLNYSNECSILNFGL